MKLDEKTVAELANQLGLKGTGGINASKLAQMEGKSDAQLSREIMDIRRQLEARGITPQKQISILKSLMPMMDAQQKKRLQGIIQQIERDIR